MEVIESEPKICEKSANIEINDIFDELKDENTRLRNELLFANKYISILSKFKLYLDKNSHRIERFSEFNYELKSLYSEFNNFIIENTVNQNSIKISNNDNANQSIIQDLRNEETNVGKNIKSKKVKHCNNVADHISKPDSKGAQLSADTDCVKALKSKTKTKSTKTADINKSPNEKKFKCDVPQCNYRAIRPQILRDHKNSHLGLRPYKCTESDCNKTFSMFKNMKKHVKDCHSDQKPNKCPECGLQMVSKKRLQTHMRKHSGEKPFVCEWPECNYRTTQLVNLRHHQNSKHTGERPYKCTYDGCNADFIYPGSLHSHITSCHTDLKFKCDWPGCEAIHKHKKSFIAHRLSHSDIKPYSCDWPGCEYATRRPELLRNHKFTHTGERNYSCSWPACDKKFKTQKALREHLMIHNDDKRYSCKWPGCDYRCVSSGNIVKHFNVHHKKA